MIATAPAEYRTGQLFRSLSRFGLWQVTEVCPGRVKAKPVSDVWVATPRWFGLAEIVRSQS